MKKFAMIAALAGATLLVMAGCGKKEEDMKYLNDFKASKYVDLGQYKGIEVTGGTAEVSDEELQQYVDYVLAYYTENKPITGRDVIKNGDIVNLDFVGKIDGEEFDGGTAEGYELEIGSGSFIDGFEAGMVGMKIGETKDLELKFPEGYGAEDLAGKDVVFTVTANSIMEAVIPELTDEFVASMGQEYTTVEGLKDALYNDLLAESQAYIDEDIDNQIQAKLEEICKVNGAPSGFTNRIYNTLIEGLEESAAQYGVDAGTLATYYYGVNTENYAEELKSFVNDSIVHQYIILGAIAEKENLKVTDAEMNDEIKSMLAESGSTYSVDEYKEMIGDTESYREYLVVEKVMSFLRENAVVNE